MERFFPTMIMLFAISVVYAVDLHSFKPWSIISNALNQQAVVEQAHGDSTTAAACTECAAFASDW
jgi:hypothetical protein